MIQTVCGDIENNKLGICMTHEHVWCDQSLGPKFYLFDNSRDKNSLMLLNDYNKQLSELKLYKQYKGNSLVEVTCEGWGRDLNILYKLSKKSKVHIIATTGFYTKPCIPNHAYKFNVNKLSDYLVKEIEVGNENNIKCGILKTSVNTARVEGIEEKGLKAVAKAQKITGVSITTHTTGSRRQEIKGGNASYEILDYLVSEGVKPEKLIFGHVDERPDIRLLKKSAKKGSYIQFDTVGKEHWLLDKTRADLIKALIDFGFLNKILISQDRNRYYEMTYGGNKGYCNILDNFVLKLKNVGITNSQINQIIISNPQKALERN